MCIVTESVSQHWVWLVLPLVVPPILTGIIAAVLIDRIQSRFQLRFEIWKKRRELLQNMYKPLIDGYKISHNLSEYVSSESDLDADRIKQEMDLYWEKFGECRRIDRLMCNLCDERCVTNAEDRAVIESETADIRECIRNSDYEGAVMKLNALHENLFNKYLEVVESLSSDFPRFF